MKSLSLLPVVVFAFSFMVAPAFAQSTPAAPPVSDRPIHQLRIYGLLEETRPAFHARFRDEAARIMRRHGFTIVAMWETRHADRPEFVYLLSWPNETAMTAAWTGFLADEEWIEIKRLTAAEHGRMMDGIEDRTLRLTDYSPVLGQAAPGD